MDKYNKYVCKGRPGKEAPIKTAMMVYISNPKRINRPQMLNIVFSNYLDIIGDQRYVAWKAEGDRIYFRFERDNTNVHTYKLFSAGSDVLGDPIAFNVYKQPDAAVVKRFCNSLKYPVYYCKSTDEYHIRLEDTKRKPLFKTKKRKERV